MSWTPVGAFSSENIRFLYELYNIKCGFKMSLTTLKLVRKEGPLILITLQNENLLLKNKGKNSREMKKKKSHSLLCYQGSVMKPQPVSG